MTDTPDLTLTAVQVQAASSSIIITYSVNTTYTVNATSTVTLKACYSPASTVNRAWRKPNDVIAVSCAWNALCTYI